MKCSDCRTSVNCLGKGKLYGAGDQNNPYDFNLYVPHKEGCKTKIAEAEFIDTLHKNSLTSISDNARAYANAKTKSVNCRYKH